MFFLVSAMIVVGGLTRLTDSGFYQSQNGNFSKDFFPHLIMMLG
tara:strand:+ start:295 stop:426 length:132 start_codon:yes stop_codon:yes gene_type:complete